MNFWAHSKNTHGRLHALAEHLSSVGRLAKDFAFAPGLRYEAELTGLLHDIGKYGDLFQKRLQGTESGLDHWSQGAWLACVEHQCVAAALAIQGHHLGLQSLSTLSKSIPKGQPLVPGSYPAHLRLSEANTEVLKQRYAEDGLRFSTIEGKVSTARRIDAMLDVRRLFSALVDADYLDTEAHFDGDASGKRPRCPAPELRPDAALAVLHRHLATLTDGTHSHPMQGIRDALLEACLNGATGERGLHTLTAPTGSGKTLAMLAYALKHAATYKLRRVVMVIPYLTIIEQTAGIYRQIFEPHFGESYVLEHHSLAGLGPEMAQTDAEGVASKPGMSDVQRRRQQQTENWDAPLIVTTSVQMLESLFSNRPSTCRKLHRLADSVILFDEVQTLPTQLAVPTLAALSHLVSDWGCTVVFSTATQPAFDAPVIHNEVRKQCSKGWQPTPLISTPLDAPRRVKWEWREDEALDAGALAQQLSAEGRTQTLSILNTKAHARSVFESLATVSPAPVRQLSTNLCPLHRRTVLDEVRQRLRSNEPIHLVATQCVEAGVDVDFPEVWRAFAPLDALIQAAGRCNRNAKSAEGRMVVFAPDRVVWPDRLYEQAAQATRTLLQLRPGARANPETPHTIRAYYELLYGLRNIGLSPELDRAIKDLDFSEVAKEYRLIRQDSINIVVPYQGALDLHTRLLAEAGKQGIRGAWMREARGISVSLFRPKPNDSAWDSLCPLQERHRGTFQTSEDWFTVAKPEHYHPDLGLDLPKGLNLYIA